MVLTKFLLDKLNSEKDDKKIENKHINTINNKSSDTNSINILKIKIKKNNRNIANSQEFINNNINGIDNK